ncbi:MAG TPA: hypothetical protein VNT81_22885 [Vicinamibacterales bacterium]|nr:hypothetical protein [Vicinamibacterales bacterium]
MRLDEQIGRLEDTVAKEFHKQGKRFDAMEITFDKHGQRLGSIDTKLDNFQSDVRHAFQLHDDRLGALEKTVGAGFRDIASRIEKLGSRRPRRGKRQ